MALQPKSKTLNIKNKNAHRLANQLAKLTGENMSDAVTTAIRERLDRVRNHRGEGIAARLARISREAAPLWVEPYRSTPHGELLYDERGLPK